MTPEFLLGILAGIGLMIIIEIIDQWWHPRD